MTLYQTLSNYEKTLQSIKYEVEEIVRHPENTENKNFKELKDEYSQFGKELANIKNNAFIHIMKNYEDNTVFRDAIKGRMSILDSLESLDFLNRDYRKYTPRTKSKIVNNRVENLGELIDKPHIFKHNGVHTPDNIITAGIYGATGAYLLTKLAIYLNTQGQYAPQVDNVPGIMSAFGGIVYGLVAQTFMRGNQDIPKLKSQAKYLDEKIKEYYFDKKNTITTNTIIIK